MSLPYLSVVVPTMRVGGLDVLTHGLRGQVFRDFELVLVDALRDLRGHALDEEEYQVTHVAPVDNPFPLNAFCRYANTGLLHARGEIVVFVTDYTYLPPDCLQRHAQFHASHDFVEALMCPHQYLGLPPLRSSFPTYKQSEVERYALDVEAGKLDDCMWTIFQKEFSRADADSLPLDAIYGWADPKMKMGSGPIDPTFFHAKNESVRREHVNAIDGWDEQLDHAHCLAPSTPILHADMTWRPIGDVRVGDVLVGFDEHQPEPGKHRKYRDAVVEKVIWSKRATQKITLDDGSEIVATPDHQWLCGSGKAKKWKKKLKVGKYLLSMVEPRSEFVEDEPYMRGYVAGMTAGDGTVRFADNGRSRDSKGKMPYWRVALVDKEPLERLIAYLPKLGVKGVEMRDFDGGPNSVQKAFRVETRNKANLDEMERILSTVDDPDSDRQYQRGFLSGFYDAEGSDDSSLGLTQRTGATWDRVLKMARNLGFNFRQSVRPGWISGLPIATGRLVGDVAERLRFYAEVNPAMSRKRSWWRGRAMASQRRRIVAIEPMGEMDVVDIQTSTRTFVANGFASHNCYQDSDLADRLSTLRGVRWILDQTNVAYIVNPRTVFCFPKRERNESDNERIWHERKAAGYPGRVDSILREGGD
jgi:hypothetical protein